MSDGHDRFENERGFYVGLFLAGLAVLAAIVGYPEIRYDVAGLQEMRGRIVAVDTPKSRLEGYRLIVELATESGVVLLSQRAVGGPYGGALSPGQDIRAWVGPRDGDAKEEPTYPVWQIERGGRIVMPAMAVGDKVLEKYLTLCGGLLFPLLGGLYLAYRSYAQYAAGAGGQA